MATMPPVFAPGGSSAEDVRRRQLPIVGTGAGIVAGSDPEAELAEAQAKFVAMRDALAASGKDMHGEATFVEALAPTSVLDAGCGTGQITEQLAERLPRGRVVALDGSPQEAGAGAALP